MTLSRLGFREWGGSLAVATIASIALVESDHPEWIALVAFFWLACAAFFRSPKRALPAGGDETLISPADGTISAIERVPHHDALNDGEAVVVRIFLSVLNVHTNCAPCQAVVTRIEHRNGRFLDARSPESAVENERVDIQFRRTDGGMLGIRQIAGAIARRIICNLREGDSVRRCETWGLIKFGSTTELIIPARETHTVLVRVGDKVVGGTTPLIRVGS